MVAMADIFAVVLVDLKAAERSDDVGIGKTRLHTHQIFHNVS